MHASGIGLCQITGIDEGTCILPPGSIVAPQHGRSAVAAHWASWADAVGMIQNRHPTIAATIVRALEIGSPVPAITAVVGCIAVLGGFVSCP